MAESQTAVGGASASRQGGIAVPRHSGVSRGALDDDASKRGPPGLDPSAADFGVLLYGAVDSDS
jgi:hypothetical protein